jgi:dihydroorotase-like cyclic amidohydrolase
LIKNGRIVDSSGMPSCRGDVAVRAGKIVELGKFSGAATRVMDADGLEEGLHTGTLPGRVLWNVLYQTP